MKKVILIVLSILTCFYMAIGLTSCGKDGQSNTPTIEIGSDGYWYVNGTKTDYKANGEQGEKGDSGEQGEKGDKGDKGDSGEQGEKGDKGDKGSDGINGSDGVDGKDGINGSDGKDGINGSNGKDGVDGKTPEIKIGENGNWFIDGVDTNVKAQGEKGDKGDAGEKGSDGKDGLNGSDGKDGNGVKTIVINDKGELIITLDDGTVINAGQVVAPEKHIDENNQIICKTFEKGDKTIYGKVSNDTDTFYFTDEIELKGGASYSVYKNFDYSEEIISKAVKLNVGDNTFYILEKCGNDSKFYTVTVRRREIYTVTFTVDDGTLLENATIKVEEDGIVPKESIPASTDGYDFVWDYDFTKPVTENIVINATVKAIYVISGNTITGLTDYGETLPVLNIPSEIDGKKITNIGYRAFYKYTSLTSVTIPDSVTGIGERAFEECSSLASITIPNSVTSIGVVAFFGCTSLTNITIPNAVTSIGNSAFGECTVLTNVTIPNGLTRIENAMFMSCRRLMSITIPANVTSMGAAAFEGSSLTKVNYLGTIDQWAEIRFENYSSNPLGCSKKLYINNELVTEANLTTATKISDYAFYSCRELTSITIADSVTSIGSSAFSFCAGLTNITIPDSVTSIGSSAFSFCAGLMNITIPDSVNSIEAGVFYFCNRLTSITIPDSVTSIDFQAFSGCQGLKRVFYKGAKKQWDEIELGDENDSLLYASLYYYSETEPVLNAEGTAYDDNYWRYDADGKTPLIWEKETIG